ncbi:hypothetical protein IH980_00175 [Patescibacteria group bacterium]|nr:hypothetical protein [Patescibacteria group bacterium]
MDANELGENLHEEPAGPAEQEDPYGFEKYFDNHLSTQINQFGELSERGKQGLRRLWDGRWEAEKMWQDMEIETQERIRMKSDVAAEVRQEYLDLFSEDEAFAEGVSIVVDQSG